MCDMHGNEPPSLNTLFEQMFSNIIATKEWFLEIKLNKVDDLQIRFTNILI